MPNRIIRPGTLITSVLRRAPEGIGDELTVGMINPLTGAYVLGPGDPGEDINEVNEPSGNYSTQIEAPDYDGELYVQWVHDNGVDDPIEMLDEWSYTISPTATLDPIAIEGAYATLSQLEAYLEDGLPEGYDDEYLEKVLVKASHDVDLYSNRYHWTTDSNLKYFEDGETYFEWIEDLAQQGIVEATCAQAEYRLAKGDQFFVEAQAYTGRFSNVQRKEPRFGPKAAEALQRTGLIPRLSVATMR